MPSGNWYNHEVLQINLKKYTMSAHNIIFILLVVAAAAVGWYSFQNPIQDIKDIKQEVIEGSQQNEFKEAVDELIKENNTTSSEEATSTEDAEEDHHEDDHEADHSHS